MDSYQKKLIETVEFLEDRLKDQPEVGLIVGTGLGNAAGTVRVTAESAYDQIPHFSTSTVVSHAGKLLAGNLQGRNIVVMKGRFHLYEGYSALAVAYPVRVMQKLGVKTLIVTNAAGGLNPSYRPGDIMAISDHINLTGENPLIGLTDAFWGDRFPDMTTAYSRQMIDAALQAGEKNGVRVHSGVYAGLKGPSLETPAETRFLKTIGADAVGFSTVQEVIAAVQAKMQVLGLSVVTNANDPDHPLPAAVDEILSVARRATSGLGAIIGDVVKAVGESV